MFLSFFRKNSTEDSVVKNENVKIKNIPDIVENITKNNSELKDMIYDFIRTIKDPEKPTTLENLNVVYEDGISVKPTETGNKSVVRVEFNPTVPHCSLATLIGLCIRVKIERSIPQQLKLDIYIKKGAHDNEDEINKQINDKERIAAAMENPNLKELVENCVKDED